MLHKFCYLCLFFTQFFHIKIFRKRNHFKTTVGDNNAIKFLISHTCQNTFSFRRRKVFRFYAEKICCWVHGKKNIFPLSHKVVWHYIHILLGKSHSLKFLSGRHHNIRFPGAHIMGQQGIRGKKNSCHGIFLIRV